MGIKANFSMNDVRKHFDAFLDMVEKKQIERLQLLGEMCVREARTNKGYMMQTGALLSSTGYEIFVDGVAIHSQFDVANGADGEAATNGVKAGQDVAEKIGKETKGVALVVVAGMNYAYYVEAKGYNVLHQSNILLQQHVKELKERLNKK